MTRAYATIYSRAFQATQKRDAGQGILEYVGMIALAAVFVAGIFAAASGLDLATKLGDAADKILGNTQ